MPAHFRIVASQRDDALKTSLAKALTLNNPLSLVEDAEGDGAFVIALWREGIADEEAEQIISACLSAANGDRLVLVEIDGTVPPFGLRDLATITWKRSTSAVSLERRVRKHIALLSLPTLTPQQARWRGAVISLIIAVPAVAAAVALYLSSAVGLVGALVVGASFALLSVTVYWCVRALLNWLDKPFHRARNALRRRRLGILRGLRLLMTSLPILSFLTMAAVNTVQLRSTSIEMISDLGSSSSALRHTLDRRDAIADRIATVEFLLSTHRPDGQLNDPDDVRIISPDDLMDVSTPDEYAELQSELSTLYEQYVAELVAQSKHFEVPSRIADASQYELLRINEASLRYSLEASKEDAARWRWSAGGLGCVVVGLLVFLAWGRGRAASRDRKQLQLSVREATVTPSQALFISYARRDAARVDTVIAAIEGLGRSVWMDRRALTGDGEWTAQLASAITRAGGVVVMCSKAAFASDYVARELHLAMQEKKSIFAFDLEPAEEPLAIRFILAGAQRFDVSSGDVGDAVRRALAQGS